MSVLNTGKRNASIIGLEPLAGVTNNEEIMSQYQRNVNEHFKAADRMAYHLPYILTPQVKRMQQKAIIRELLAGLRGVA